MFFAWRRPWQVPELGPRTRAALERLLPASLTLLVPHPRRSRWPAGPSPAAWGCGSAAGRGPGAAGRLRTPVRQSSANRAGGAEARRIEDVDEGIRAGVDMQLDGGELPGVASTVVDLSLYEEEAAGSVVREGAVAGEAVAAQL